MKLFYRWYKEMLKELIKQKRSGHLHIRVYKSVDSDNFETICTSAKYPYWRKVQRTNDQYLVKETFWRWSIHIFFLQFLPAKFCHDFVMKRW